MKYLLPFLVLFGPTSLAIPSQLCANDEEAVKAVDVAINVTPLRLELPQSETATRMQVRNRAGESLNVQVRVFEWTQEGGEDRYKPTRDITISPSIVSIESGRAQSFHVVASADRSVRGEKRYRVIIDELPGVYQPVAGTTRTMLRLSVPLFVDRDESSSAKIDLEVRPGVIRLRNEGEQTVRLVGLSLNNADGPVPFAPSGTLRYIHGGSWIELELPPGAVCQGQPLRLTALADSEKLDAVAAQDCT